MWRWCGSYSASAAPGRLGRRPFAEGVVGVAEAHHRVGRRRRGTGRLRHRRGVPAAHGLRHQRRATGAGAALAQVSNELGIAVGLTVLGSLGTVIYRVRPGLPDGTTAAGSVVGLAGVAVLILVLALTRRAPAPSHFVPAESGHSR